MIQLYKKTKTGKIQVVKLWTQGAHLYTEYGELEGKLQLSKVECVGKNIGKSNETTPAQQAVSQMTSKAQLKKDKGYFDTIREAMEGKVYLPMLAKDGRKFKITYPCDAQPKLDGVRCMGTNKGLMSRGGKAYDVKHIQEALPKSTIPKVVFDGELYIHGILLQDLVSRVKKPKDGSEKVEYWVYDVYLPEGEDVPWSRRKNYLETIVSHINEGFSKQIKLVPTVRVNNEKEMLKLHAKFVSEGYEGIILRSLEGIYELGHRSSNLIKYKEFLDDEFLITGYKEGKGKMVGCVIWECVTEDNKTFDVVPKGTLEQKKEWYNEANDIVGKYMTVKYQGLTESGKPQFAVGLAIRDYES